MSSGWFYLSTPAMTIAVQVSDGTIVSAPPIARKFIGQHPERLGVWLRKQGPLTVERLRSGP